MKIKYIINIRILLFCFLLIFQSCELFEDNPPQLPEATQSGKDTFGFLLNGEVINITNTYHQTVIYQGGFIQFGAGGVYMTIDEPFVENVTYEFKNIGQSTASARFYRETSENSYCLYDFSDTYEGSITFTKIDKVNYFISGIFEYSTKKADCEKINITNGRFDLKYRN